MSADSEADLRRRAAPSARTRHGGEVIDAAEVILLRVKPAPRISPKWFSTTCSRVRENYGALQSDQDVPNSDESGYNETQTQTSRLTQVLPGF